MGRVKVATPRPTAPERRRRLSAKGVVTGRLVPGARGTKRMVAKGGGLTAMGEGQDPKSLTDSPQNGSAGLSSGIRDGVASARAGRAGNKGRP